MGTRHRTLLYQLALLFAPVALRGQSPAPGDTLLARLTTEALATSPSVLRGDALARAATARVRPAGALPDPMVSVGVMDLTLPRFGFRESDFTEVDVEITQQFPWPGMRGAQTGAARAMSASAHEEVAALRRETTVRVAELYYRLRYVVSARTALAGQRTRLQGAVEIATTRYSTGSAPQTDPLQARTAVARLGADDATLAAEEASLRADLKAVRGVSTGEQLVIAPLLPDSLPAILQEVDTEHAAHLAAVDPLADHPRLAARRADVEASRETARAEALSARPDFEVSTRYGARPLGADFFSAFVGVRIPLWAGRKQRLTAEAANLDATAAQQRLNEERSMLGAELERTLASARAGAARLHILVDSVLPLAREGVDVALRSYGTGRGDFQSVLTAEETRYQVEVETAGVAAEHLTHLVMLEQLLAPEVSR